VTQNLNHEISQHLNDGAWTSSHAFISFNVESDMPVIKNGIENEPLPATFSTGVRRKIITLIIIVVGSLAFVFRYRRQVRHGLRR
jgi:hypothetical protein